MQLYLHLDDEDNEAYVADVLEDVEEVPWSTNQQMSLI